MQTVLSGVQPSGSLHLGNLVGAIENYVKLQNEFKTYYMIADWHSLTSRFDSTDSIIPAIYEVAATFLAVGLDPEKSALFAQSQIKEHAELHLLLSMITPLSWVERVPTYKEKLQNSEADLGSYGFLGYPILQAADILIYKAHKVPVGEDQMFHLELTREIGRRFNFLYKKEVFPDPQAVLTQAHRVPGLDGRKMSKTYDNGIYLRDTPDQILHKCTRQMASDTARARRTDPGSPGACTAFTFHKLFSAGETVDEIAQECPKAGIGCFDCKKRLAEKLIERLEPLRTHIEDHLKNTSNLEAILKNGADSARAVAVSTMAEVRETMKTPQFF
ncbi:MAG: tryptophan--tRNA ligase [Holophagales bacterium]|jgi:tryptophanyl-tRNA synthetase|nr:tryptophan--tRNA ligase [Holophagales bacterium]